MQATAYEGYFINERFYVSGKPVHIPEQLVSLQPYLMMLKIQMIFFAVIIAVVNFFYLRMRSLHNDIYTLVTNNIKDIRNIDGLHLHIRIASGH